jgi:hypothetical protein
MYQIESTIENRSPGWRESDQKGNTAQQFARGMTEHVPSYGLDCNTLHSSGKIIQKVRWVVICRDADA